MTQDTHKNYNRNIYRKPPKLITHVNWSNYNSTPTITHDDEPLRKLIRSQVRPFAPISNDRRVIDFQTAIIPESEKRYHCAAIFDMLNRLAECWNTVNHITAEMLYTVYEMYEWRCAVTKVLHSVDRPYTPLSVEFLRPVHAGGRMVVSNIRPIFYSGWFRGEYRWVGMYSTYRQAVA